MLFLQMQNMASLAEWLDGDDVAHLQTFPGLEVTKFIVALFFLSLARLREGTGNQNSILSGILN